ncbi:hypothetical protein [Corynebacterium diphtheriae]|uniref:hypothetical protein n=1 Tax=Corynebacterium diphtheriae TaxID=1717 RepID=UPI00203E23AD|nr:hypothetical protein [Corynebacterium diphtheriae]
MRDNTHSLEGVARLLLRSETVARNVAILDTINADLAYKDELVLDDIVAMQTALVHVQFETIQPFAINKQ